MLYYFDRLRRDIQQNLIQNLTELLFNGHADYADYADINHNYQTFDKFIFLTQRRRERRVHTDILFRTRIYRISRIDDKRLLTPPLAALTPPLRWEGSWLPPPARSAPHPNLQARWLTRLPTLAAGTMARSAPHPSCRHDGTFSSPPL